MKKKYRTWILAWACLFVPASYIAFRLLSPSGHDHRTAFEKTLLDLYKEVPVENPALSMGLPGVDRPDLAAFRDYLMCFDPALKRVPAERRNEAMLTREKMLRKKNLLLAAEYQWKEMPSAMGGRVRALMFDPNDPENRKVWAGAVTGGLWYNDNIHEAFSRWKPVSDVWENLSISSLAYDPLDPQVMYAGTGEPQTAVIIYRESGGRGAGIWKTTDGGLNWNLLPSTMDFAYISDLVVREEEGKAVIYAGVVSGTYKGQVHPGQPSDGLYRSDDGGNNWEQVFPLIPGFLVPYAPSDLEISSGGRLFAGTMRNLDGEGAACILYSDDGRNWQVYNEMQQEIQSLANPLINIPGRVMLASAPSDPQVVYAVIASGGFTPAGFIFYKAYTVLRSDNHGLSWMKTGMPSPDGSWATLAWHALVIGVDPNDPNVVYAGGLDQHKTTDAGMTWDHISDWRGMYVSYDSPQYIHADQHCVVFAPGSSDTILFATDGAMFYTTNGTSSEMEFEERNHHFNTIQYYTCAIHPLADEVFYIGGTQDNGTLLHRGPAMTKYDMLSGGDGAFCFIPENDPSRMITSVYYNRYYLFRRDAEGTIQYIRSFGQSGTGTFVSPADFDHRTSTLYANAVTFEGKLTDSLFRVKNMINGPVEQLIPANTGSPVPFSAVKVSPYAEGNESVVFLGTASGRLFKLTNAAFTPEAVEVGSTMFPAANISCVETGRSDNELLVTFSNYGVSSVWYSPDGGSSWEDLEANLPDIPVRWAVFHPVEPDRIIIATEIGVWESAPLGSEPFEWLPVGGGLPNVRVDMIRRRESDNTLLAATHGRGFFTCRFESPAGGLSMPGQPVSGLKVYPNPGRGRIFFRADEKMESEMVFSLIDAGGKILETGVIRKVSAGEEYSLELSVPPGVYFLKLSSGNTFQMAKVIIER